MLSTQPSPLTNLFPSSRLDGGTIAKNTCPAWQSKRPGSMSRRHTGRLSKRHPRGSCRHKGCTVAAPRRRRRSVWFDQPGEEYGGQTAAAYVAAASKQGSRMLSEQVPRFRQGAQRLSRRAANAYAAARRSRQRPRRYSGHAAAAYVAAHHSKESSKTKPLCPKCREALRSRK